MKNEIIDCLSKNGLPLGTQTTIIDAHKNGCFHNTVHIWCYTKKGEVLLAQRAATKIICPFLWDVSAAGHVMAGETIVDAAIRETFEELGLQIKKDTLQKVGVFKSFQTYDNGIIDNEFHHTFIIPLKLPLSKLKPQPEEVEAVKLISIPEFYEKLNFRQSNNHFIESSKPHYLAVVNAIEEMI